MPNKKIAIDTSRLLTSTPTGVELYCRQIIQGLLAKSADLILYTPRQLSVLAAKNQKILNWPFKKLWSQTRLALELLMHPPHIFFSPGYVIPFLFLLNSQTKKIVTIHDVAFIHLPRSYSFLQRWFLKLTTRQAVKYAHRIIVPTQATKNDLVKYFNCSGKKIVVTYFGQQLTGNQQSVNRQKQLLYIGRIENKKNISNLITAFKLFHQQYPDYKLILAGKPGVGFKTIKLLISRYTFIDYHGYVSPTEKDYLLRTAKALVLLSKYEGFGFPLLEAFNYQLPVLASDIPVLHEIGQTACLFVRYDNILEIAKKIESIIINKELRQQLIQSGQQRLQFFSWSRCIDQTWQTLNS